MARAKFRNADLFTHSSQETTTSSSAAAALDPHQPIHVNWPAATCDLVYEHDRGQFSLFRI